MSRNGKLFIMSGLAVTVAVVSLCAVWSHRSNRGSGGAGLRGSEGTTGAEVLPPAGVDEQLVEALINGRLAEADQALLAGANANARLGGLSVLHYAALSGHPEAVEYLLREGADANGLADDGDTPLGCAVHAVSESPESARLLLEAGADPELPRSPHTPLRAATSLRRFQTAQVLMAYGADPAAKGEKDDSALEYAKTHGLDDFVRLFEEAGSARSGAG